MPRTLTIPDAAAALRALTDAAIKHRPTPFVLRDPKTIPPRGSLDLVALARDPIGTACRAEIRRIGECLSQHGLPALDAALEAVAGGYETPGASRRKAVIRGAWIRLDATVPCNSPPTA